MRLGLVTSAYAGLTYAMVFLEPKDRVHFRWLGERLGHGAWREPAEGLQAFMMSYFATFAVSLVLILWLGVSLGDGVGTALVAARLGFVTRDVGIFVLLHALPGRRRGDLTAVLVLFALYLLIPAILNGLGFAGALVLFYPKPGGMAWLSAVFAWSEAIAVVAAALGRIVLAQPPARSETAPA